MAGAYRGLFLVPGSRAFFVAGFAGRMSISMIGISIVLLVSAVTGSYGVAGAVAAAYAIGSAAATPIAGRLTDRHGQHPVLFAVAAGTAVLAAGLVPVALARGLPLMMVMIFFAGLAVAPTLIPGFGLVERLVPGHRLTEGLSWLATAVRIGITAPSRRDHAVVHRDVLQRCPVVTPCGTRSRVERAGGGG